MGLMESMESITMMSLLLVSCWVYDHGVKGVVGLLSWGVHQMTSGRCRRIMEVRIPINLYIGIAVGTYKGIYKSIIWSYVFTVSKCRDILVNKKWNLSQKDGELTIS